MSDHPWVDDIYFIVQSVFWLAMAVNVARNLVSLIQLCVAGAVFGTRIAPDADPRDLWVRQEGFSPPVTVIAPAYNEELSIIESVRALLALEYPDHAVLVVNDGSKDATLARLIEGFDLYPIEREPLATLHKTRVVGVYGAPAFPNLTVIDKENGRKADAVNVGISYACTPLVCVIDADSLIEPDGLLRATSPYMTDDGSLAAVGGAIRIANGCSIRGGHVEAIAVTTEWLPRFQIIEYLRAFLTARVANAYLGVLLLISGAFGVFDRKLLIEIGGYRHDTVGEDLEIIVRIHRHMLEQRRPYRIAFVPEVVCWTEAPASLAGLKAQRARWQRGALETLTTHRKMLFNWRYGRVGMVAMPLLILEDIVGPPAELIGYFIVVFGYASGMIDGLETLGFFGVSVLFGTALSVGTLILEERQLRRLPDARSMARMLTAALVENFGYRQVNLWFRLLGVWRHVNREQGWTSAPRAGFTPKKA